MRSVRLRPCPQRLTSKCGVRDRVGCRVAMEGNRHTRGGGGLEQPRAAELWVDGMYPSEEGAEGGAAGSSCVWCALNFTTERSIVVGMSGQWCWLEAGLTCGC